MKRFAAMATVVLGFSVAACAGDDDGQRKRSEAAAWCKVTASVDRAFDDTEGRVVWTLPIPYDEAEEWVETAPEEIRASTERAAEILRQALTDPDHPDLVAARNEIGTYAAEHCAAPARCLADVEGNPRLPCIHPFEERRRR